ncbi:MAG TPA: tetratricopeptide repeat protein [Pseudonocardiaceae bacterium]|nr:tetratricopeptide repeat protein [Pseudonocardiaceae bacterium]
MNNSVTECPYVGFRPFRAEDCGRFFGRSTESRDLAALWRANRLTVLYGASGVGKTSLLMAGVIPLLDPGSAEVLPPGRVSHGSTFPLAALPEHNPYTFALLTSWSPDEPETSLAGLAVPDFLRRHSKRTDRHGRPLPVFAAIDQAEELFAGSAHHNRHRRPFINELVEALDEHPDLHLLLSIRESSRVDLIPYEHDLGHSSQAWFRLLPLTPETALEAVREPLEGTDRSFAPGAAEGLVDSLRASEIVSATGQRSSVIAEDVEPALLQIVCSQLWETLPDDINVIRSHQLRTYADVGRTLTDFCGRVLITIADDHGLHATELRSWLQRTFVTELGRRNTVAEDLKETAGMPNAVVRALENRHILKAERRSGSRWYELQHDRLIEPIRRMDDTVLRLPPQVRPAEYLRTAAEALAAGELALAEEQAERALYASADTDLRLRAEAESFLGNIAHERGEPTQAEAHYRAAAPLFEVLQDTPTVARTLAAIGQSVLAQGRRAEAMDELRAAVERVPNDLTVQTELAWTLWHLGQQSAAITILTGVLAIDGNAPAALRARGEILAAMGDAENALRDLNRVRRQQRPATRAARGLALAMVRNLGEADQEIAIALSEAPESGPVLLYAARVAALSGDPVMVADRARRALVATDPPLPPHQREAALSILNQGGQMTARAR